MTTQHTTERMIQEYVPGKQVTLAHVIANPGRICLRNWVYQTPFLLLAF